MKFKRRKIKRGRVEVIPMIDTITILLIFYMTYSRFAEQTRAASIKLPSSLAGDEFKQFPNQVIINMFSSDKLLIGEDELKMTELANRLRALKASSPEMSKNMSVILRGDSKMTYQDLSDFMKACAKAGIADVTFATLEASRR